MQKSVFLSLSWEEDDSADGHEGPVEVEGIKGGVGIKGEGERMDGGWGWKKGTREGPHKKARPICRENLQWKGLWLLCLASVL